jgi:hypothetical protein
MASGGTYLPFFLLFVDEQAVIEYPTYTTILLIRADPYPSFILIIYLFFFSNFFFTPGSDFLLA